MVGEVTGREINIIGIGTHPSVGLRKGVVVNIESTVESIKKAVEEAELMAGCEISSVYAGIAGGHITGFNSRGIVAVKGQEITQQDVDRVIDAARAVAIPMDREVIHVLPQEYIVDDQNGIQNPVGMAGVRLEAKIHIVTGAVTRPTTSSSAPTGPAWMCATSCSSAWPRVKRCSPRKRSSWDRPDRPRRRHHRSGHLLGQEHQAHLRAGPGGRQPDQRHRHRRAGTPERGRADQAKYGTCNGRPSSPDETIEVPGMGGRQPRKLPRQILGEILEPRMEEIFTLLQREIYRAGMENMIASGIVLCGGTALLEGATDIAEAIFGLPTRLGKPRGIGGLTDVVNNPMYATGVGLVIYGAKKEPERKFRIRDRNIFNSLIARMKKWFKDVI